MSRHTFSQSLWLRNRPFFSSTAQQPSTLTDQYNVSPTPQSADARAIASDFYTPGPAALRNRTYPLRVILTAIGDYDLGYTLEETAMRVRKKTGHRVSPSTVTSWLNKYRHHCTYRRLRADGLRRYPPEQTVHSIKLYHRQVYGYAYHRPKLDFVRAGTLDNKRVGDTRFVTLADFLESVPTTCPHDLFRREDDPKARASQGHPTFEDISRVIVNLKRSDGHSRTYHPCCRQQQTAARNSAALHADQRQRDRRNRGADLAHRG